MKITIIMIATIIIIIVIVIFMSVIQGIRNCGIWESGIMELWNCRITELLNCVIGMNCEIRKAEHSFSRVLCNEIKVAKPQSLQVFTRLSGKKSCDSIEKSLNPV